MPVKVRKVNGYRVSTPGGVKAKNTTKAKAKKQARLIRAVKHGYDLTKKKRMNLKKRKAVMKLRANKK